VIDFLLVHGAFCGGWVWDDVVGRLTKAGHRAHVVDQLPSSGVDTASLGDLSDDADHVRAMLDTIAQPVVLVGHSYGGMVLAELADHPLVRHSVYLTAMWPRRGQSLIDTFGGALPASVTHRADGALQVTNDFDVAWGTFGRGFERDAAKQMLARLVPQSNESANDPSTAPDRTHPTTYLIAAGENDPAVAAQEAWSADADHVVRLPGAHMLMLSHPDDVARALLDVSID
jgi:pimeloyl-ACP methyl ester carboxylesterase